MLVNRRRLTISIPPELYEWLEKQAAKEYTMKGRLIERLLSDYKKEVEKIKEI